MAAPFLPGESAPFLPGERARPDWLREHPRAWLAAVGTVCFGAFMGQLDASIVALTYRPIGHEFHASLDVVQWVSLGYLLALAGLLVPLGRISDRLGRKRVYLWGFGLFSIASLGCALAPDLGSLVTLRVVQGAGAAMLQANSIALVSTTAPRGRLRAALGLQAAAQAVGLALGPTVGGLLVQSVGWRWVFGVNVPVGVVAIVAGRYLLPRTRVDAAAEPSGVRATLATPGITRGTFGALLGYLLLFGPIVAVPALVQARGVSPTHAGLTTAALPVGFAVASAMGERLVPVGWSSRRRSELGLLVAGLGLAALTFTATSDLAVVGLAVLGLGLGVFIPANNAAIMTRAPVRSAAVAGGLVSAARAIGTGAGVALVAGTLTSWRDGRLSVFLMIIAVAIAAAVVDRRSD
jgi:MFS family permease